MRPKEGKDKVISTIKKIGFYFLIFLINLFIIFKVFNSLNQFFSYKNNFEYTYLLDRCGNLYVTDIDKNGSDDIVTIYAEEPFPHRNVLGIFSPFSPSGLHRVKYFTEILISPNDFLLPPLDADGDGENEILFLERKKEEFILKLLDIKGIYKNSITLKNPLREGQFLTEFLLDDLENDGKIEIIAGIESAWSALPRGIIAISPSSGKILWEFYMGCSPVMFKIMDINRDGKKEIIISGRGTHNGVYANGTDDEHSYIIVLNNKGERLWQEVFGGYYTYLFFDAVDIDSDSEIEIVVSKTCHRVFLPEPGEIRILNASNGKTQKVFSESGTSFSYIYNLKKDIKNTYLIVGDNYGRVTIFDKELRKVKSISLEAPSIIKEIGKIGKNAKENSIFVQSGFTNFYILDQNLKKLHKFSFQDFPFIERLRFYKASQRDEDVGILNADRLYLVRRKSISSSLLISLFKSEIFFYILTFLFFNSLILLIKRIPAKYPQSFESLKESIETAQDIAHRMKDPMFTMQLEGEKLASLIKKTESELLKSITSSICSILEDIKSLNNLVRIFMKIIVPKPLTFQETDINNLLQDIISKYSELLKGKIEFILDLDGESTAIYVDKEQLGEAITNIILNSIEALPDGGKIKISSTVVYSPILKTKKGIIIEIEDNGIGIPSDKLKEIFKPYYSTKKEGFGIGLTLTKRIIEAHGGKINVYSKEGVGTRFAVFLPWKVE